MYIDIFNKLKYKNLDKDVFDYLDKYNDLLIKYEIGKELSRNTSIEDYSIKLKNNGIKILPTILRKYKMFYELLEKGMIFYQKLSWNHYLLLMRSNNINKINYYLYKSNLNNLSIRDLQIKLDFLEYENLQIDLKNKYKYLINKEKNNVYNFKISNSLENIESIKKIIFQRIEIINNIFNIAFVERNRNLSSSNSTFTSDFIFFNFKNNSYIIINFVINKLSNENINNINNFVSLFDTFYKTRNLNNTEALIFVYKNNNFYLEYSKYNTYELKKYHII